jgi:hypothetical protein
LWPDAARANGRPRKAAMRLVHAVLGTRRDLRLRLHQLRLAGELAEIRAADLRFSEAETRELLATSGVVLSDQALATLRERRRDGRRAFALQQPRWLNIQIQSDSSRSSQSESESAVERARELRLPSASLIH